MNNTAKFGLEIDSHVCTHSIAEHRSSFYYLCQMRYIQPFPGHCASMDPTAMVDVCALLGTPAVWKQRAALVWRAGPAHLFEEPLPPQAVDTIYTQGTGYLGNYLALGNTGEPWPEHLGIYINRIDA